PVAVRRTADTRLRQRQRRNVCRSGRREEIAVHVVAIVEVGVADTTRHAVDTEQVQRPGLVEDVFRVHEALLDGRWIAHEAVEVLHGGVVDARLVYAAYDHEI